MKSLLTNGAQYWYLGEAGADVRRSESNRNPTVSLVDTISKKQVLDLRRTQVKGRPMTWKAIGEHFGVSDKTIKRVLFGRTN